MPFVITVSGKARHGKDTLAEIIKEELEKENKSVLIIHYADLLKFICSKYLGWDGQKDEAGRTLLQYIGTDYVRSRKPTFWLDFVVSFVDVFKDKFEYFIIPDCRFPNEVDVWNCYPYKYLSVNIRRTDYESELTLEQQMHPSETALEGYEFDVVLRCASGVENIRKVVIDELKAKLIC